MQKRENIKIEPFSDKDKKEFEVIEYVDKIPLTDYIKKTIKKEINDIHEVLKTEREEFEPEWRLLDSVYDGEMQEIEGQQFNVHYGVMAEKIDNGVNRADMAFFDTERLFDISPRPDFQGENGSDVAQKQSDMLDYANEEVIKLRDQVGLVFHSAFLKGNGWLFATRKVKKQKKRDRRVFKGEPIYAIIQNGQPVPVSAEEAEKFTEETGQPFAYSNKGLESFLSEFPDYADSAYAKRLHEGKEIKIVINYDEIVYNDPYFEDVNLMDFWISKNVETLLDISETPLTVHRVSMNYRELQKAEKDGVFQNIDVVLYEKECKGKEKKIIEDAKAKDHNILRCVYWCKLTENATEEEKCIFWIAEKQNEIIGAERYQHDTIKTEYLPFYIKKKKKGIYQPGVGKDLVDDNISLDLFINFTLQMLYLHSVVIPICKKDGETWDAYFNRELVNGRPIPKGNEPIDFLNNHMKYPDVAQILGMMNKIEQRSGEKANITHGMTGKESPTDPSAPASKTLALLGEGNFNFRQYINKLAPSFNEIGYIELAMYHQMDKDSIKFRGKKGAFEEISRDELVARTEIQTQAMAFSLDKLREKQELVAFYSMMRPEMRDAEKIINLRRMVGKAWSPKIRTNIDALFPDAEDAQREKITAAVQAVDTYVGSIMEQSQAAGTPVQPDIGQLLGSIQQAMEDLANPPGSQFGRELTKEEKKQ